jgi:hypothetical protein
MAQASNSVSTDNVQVQTAPAAQQNVPAPVANTQQVAPNDAPF